MHNFQSYSHKNIELERGKAAISIDSLPHGVIPSSLPNRVLNHKILLRNHQRNQVVRDWLERPHASSRANAETNNHGLITPKQKEQHKSLSSQKGYEPPVGSQPPFQSHFVVSTSNLSVIIAAPESLPKVGNALIQNSENIQSFMSLSELRRINDNFHLLSPKALQKESIELNETPKNINHTNKHAAVPKREALEYIPLSFRVAPKAYVSPTNKEIVKENRYTQQALALVRPIALSQQDSQTILEVKPAKILEDNMQSPEKSFGSPRRLKPIITARKPASFLSFAAIQPTSNTLEAKKKKKRNFKLKNIVASSANSKEGIRSKYTTKPNVSSDYQSPKVSKNINLISQTKISFGKLTKEHPSTVNPKDTTDILIQNKEIANKPFFPIRNKSNL